MLRALPSLLTGLLAVLPGAKLAALPKFDEQKRPIDHTWQRGPLHLTLASDDASPLVVDTADVRLRVYGSAGTEVELPKLDELPKELRAHNVRRTGPTAEPDGSQVWELSFKLEVLVAGSYELPPLESRYRASGEFEWVTAATEPVTLEFRSVLGDNPDDAQPEPNPGPATMPRGPFPWLALAVVLAAPTLLGSAAWYAWRRRSQRPRPAPMTTAYRKAMDAIHRLELASWIDRGEVDRFYTELSGVVRHYIEDRFGLRAPEQTTEEFLQQLATRPVLGSAQRLALADFLEQCDLVKFAKVRPTSAEGHAALQAARGFVEATRDDAVLVPCLFRL